MSLPVVLRPEAEEDLASARDWYDRQRAGLGDDLVARVTEAIERIKAMPELSAVEWRNVRACRLRRFPFVIYYRALADRAEVLAVLHGSREAGVWQSRA